MKNNIIGIISLVAIGLSACDSDFLNSSNGAEVAIPPTPTAIEQVAVIEKPVEISFEEMVEGTQFSTWINNAEAVGILPTDNEDEIGLKFTTAKALIYVINDFSPLAGETYELSLSMKSQDEDQDEATPRVRLLLSRDCSGKGSEDSSEVHELTNIMQSYSVAHTFQQDYPCMKLVLQVLNAYPDAAKTITFSSPSIRLVTNQ